MSQEMTATVFVARTNTTLEDWGLEADDVLDIDADGSVVVNDWLVSPKNTGAEQPRTFSLSHVLEIRGPMNCIVCDAKCEFSFCKSCKISYDRWRLSPANQGDSHDLIVWAAGRARRAVAERARVKRKVKP